MTQYLYLIECKGNFKIGIANDIKSRLASLQTGNPFDLTVMACFGYENAEVVEKAIHQKFDASRLRGEWFSLDNDEITKFLNLCRLLGGVESFFSNASPLDEEIKEAEEVQEQTLDVDKWDFSSMFSDGWIMEYFEGKRKLNDGSLVKTGHNYWTWRKSENGKRKSIYGGTISSLPYPIETMRRVYRDGLPESEKQ